MNDLPKMNPFGVVKHHYTLIELMVVTVLLGMFACLILAWPLTIWTDSNLEFWLSHFKGEPVELHWILSALLVIIGNWVTVLANIISEIAEAFVK